MEPGNLDGLKAPGGSPRQKRAASIVQGKVLVPASARAVYERLVTLSGFGAPPPEPVVAKPVPGRDPPPPRRIGAARCAPAIS
jgi:hypothetical protein